VDIKFQAGIKHEFQKSSNKNSGRNEETRKHDKRKGNPHEKFINVPGTMRQRY
jgi:hypothetical protein